MSKFTVKIMPWAVGHPKFNVTQSDAQGEQLFLTYSSRLLDVAEEMLIKEGHNEGDPDAGLTMTVEVRPLLWTTIMGGVDEQE
ncbi:hypothetical protein AAII07_54290 [Microvirga sp. 0TCS3.31]